MKRLFASLMVGMLLLSLPLAPLGSAGGPFEPAVPGTTITVTTSDDDMTENGNCTLREAILAANLDQKVDNCPAGSGADTIVLPLEAYTISLSGDGEDEGLTGDLDITSPVTIVGTNLDRPRIHWTDAPESYTQEQFLHILPAAQNVTLEYLSLGGEADNDCHSGVLNEGGLTLNQVDFVNLFYRALENKETLRIMDSRFFDNQYWGETLFTNHAGASVEGSGLLITSNYGDWELIDNAGEMHLDASQISGNGFLDSPGITNSGVLSLTQVSIVETGGYTTYGVLDNKPGGLLWLEDSQLVGNYAANGIILNTGDVVIRSTNFYENGNRFGPGIINSSDGSVKIETVQIRNNNARYGGMISAGNLEIVDSTIADNRMWVSGPSAVGSTGPVTITNTTISGNWADGEPGDQFPVLSLRNGYLNHVTVTDNLTSLEYDGEPQAVLETSGPVKIHASILAGNMDGSGGNSYDCQGDTGEIISLGYNLVGNADLCNWTLAEGDQLGTLAEPLDPLLGPLGDHGGSTLTHPLLPGSPAIDAVISDTLPLDQRGVLRQAGRADSGAYEAIHLSVPATGANEGDDTDGLLAFPVTLSSPAVEPVTVTYVTTDSTALAWVDYLPASGTLVLPIGTLTATVPVTLTSDLVDEWDKSFFLHLSDIENALLDTPVVTGTVQDDDLPAVLSIQEQVAAPEGDAGWNAVTVPIELSMPSAYTVEVTYETQDDSALAGEDYQPISGTLSIPPGAHAVTLTVQIAGDDVFELDEDFSILLTDPVHAGLARSQAFVTIQNDDLPEPGLRMYLPCLRKQE